MWRSLGHSHQFHLITIHSALELVFNILQIFMITRGRGYHKVKKLALIIRCHAFAGEGNSVINSHIYPIMLV